MAEPPPRPPESEPDKEPAKPESDGQLWALAGIGVQLTVVMVVSVAAGKWVDAKFGWSPWGTLGISMLGLSAVLYWILREVNK